MSKIKRKLAMILGLSLLAISLISCNQESNESVEALKIGLPIAPPSFPVLKMIEDKSLGEDFEIEIIQWDSPEALISLVQSDECQYYASPLPVTAKLYNKGIDIKMTNAVAWGGGSILSSDPEVKTWKDLKGKTLHMTLKSAPLDVFTNYFLEENGLKAGEDIELIYGPMAEVTNLMIADQVENIAIIEPHASTILIAKEDVFEAINLTEDWKKIHGQDADIPGSGLITTGNFSRENPDFIDKFEKAYEEAVNWVIENPEGAAELGEKYFKLEKENLVESIPKMDLRYVNAQNAKVLLEEYYQSMYEFDSELVGGKIPDENLYYKK